MPLRHAFEYAIIRIVPRIERGEFINSGVILFCRSRRFLDARILLDLQRLTALAPQADQEQIREHLTHIPIVCAGGAAAGPIGLLPHHERFRWLVAPRSTIIQSSPVHAGLCIEPQDEIERLMSRMVAYP